VVINIFNKKLVKHVFDDYLGNGEVDLRLSSMSSKSSPWNFVTAVALRKKKTRVIPYYMVEIV